MEEAHYYPSFNNDLMNSTFFKEIPKYMRVVLFIIGDWNAKSRKSRDTWSNK